MNKFNNRNDFKRNADRIQSENQKNKPKLSKSNIDNIRIISLGGTDEVGKNMLAIEIREKIIIIDAGVQHSTLKMPGVDFIIPNINYLEENKHKISSIILTAGRLENIGALPFFIDKLGHPPIYARNYTLKFLQKFAYKHKQNINSPLISIEDNCTLTSDNVDIEFFGITENSYDNLSFIIKTEYGDILYFNHKELREIAEFEFLKEKNILLTLTPSENSELSDWSLKNTDIKEKLKNLIKKMNSRLLINAFPSDPNHIIYILQIALDTNKKVIIESMPIKMHIDIIKENNLFADLDKVIIDISDINKYSKENIIIFTTGPEGDEFNYLKRISENVHKYITIEPKDVILIIAHPLTHNQRAIQNLKDSLSRLGAKITHLKNSDIGIGYSPHNPNLKTLYSVLNTKFFIPVSGCHYMLRVNADIIKKLGLPENHIIIPENGNVIDIKDKGERISNTREKIDSEPWIVDGNKIGKAQNVVMKDRNTLSEQGVFFIISVIDMKTNRLRKTPDIASRGFIYLKESQDILNDAKIISKNIIEKYLDNNNFIEIDQLKSEIQSNMGKFLLQKTAKEPVIMPVIIKI